MKAFFFSLALLLGGCQTYRQPRANIIPLCVNAPDKFPTSHFPQTCEKQHYQLTINNYQLQENIVTVSATTNIRQCLLHASVDFSLCSPQGKVIINTQEIGADTPYVSNNNQLLSTDLEKEMVENEIKETLLHKILPICYANISRHIS